MDLVPGGYKSRTGDIQPFSHQVRYRGDCVGCTEEIDVVISVSLQLLSKPGELPLQGEHALSIVVTPSLSRIHTTTQWRRCFLEVKATIADKRDKMAPTAIQGAGPLQSDNKRTVLPAASHPPEWCIDEHPQMDQQEKKHQKRVGIASTRSIDIGNAPNACEQMLRANATNAAHIKYFHEQQRSESEMLAASKKGLCSDKPDEAMFQARLHNLLKPYRMAARLHTHMAFISKGICSQNTAIDRQRAIEQDQVVQLPSYAAGYFHLRQSPEEHLQQLTSHTNWTASAVSSLGWGETDKELVQQGRDSWLHLLSPYTHDEAKIDLRTGQSLEARTEESIVKSVDPEFMPHQPDPDADWCTLPILHHGARTSNRIPTLESACESVTHALTPCLSRML